MERIDIITTIGRDYLKSNTETGEFSYSIALKRIGKNYKEYLTNNAKREYKDIDLRFVDGSLTILVETKKKLIKSKSIEDMEQLQNYVNFEKALTGNKVIAILASTVNDVIRVWQDGTDIINDEHEDTEECVIKTMNEYKNIHFGTINNKSEIVQNTYQLNELLYQHGINEKIRSQFVGTCLLALKNGLVYSNPINKMNEKGEFVRVESLSTSQIRSGIEDVLTSLLNKDLNKAEKLVILKNKVIDSQDVRDLKIDDFKNILKNIETKILPYINDKNTMGQDLLNLFFTTFNKYVGKSDKNQAFTPDHIVHFMCKIVGVNRNSIVLDPCCGSGAFLVRALTEAMDDCDTESEREKIKSSQIYGIEYEEAAFGLATTNMLIHGDGNSNIKQGNCFNELQELSTKGINIVLMNPPYNAQRKHCDPEYVSSWSNKIKEDPTKGLHFVYKVAKSIKTGKLAVLLPMQCAIGASSDIKLYKKKMLDEHTLDAVFSFPSDIFHPGANAVTCCMIFDLGIKHKNATKDTFFGYFKDDGFEKRKNLGRMEKENKAWQKKESKWLELYFKRKEESGLSVVKKVTHSDEWLAEAYMKTDYSNLNQSDFQKVLNEYLGYLISNGKML